MTFRLADLFWPPRASVLLLLLVLATATPSARADDRLPQPKGPVVLSISGDIERTTDGTRAFFDVSMLEALGLVTVRTRTPWTDGTAEFEGVLLRDLLRLVGAKREVILASALNDYVAEIPPTDALKHDVILALKKDGEYLTVRNMGPILVLYPFDSDPALQTEEIYARSVWQLSELEVGAPAEDLPAMAAAKPTEPIAVEPSVDSLEAIAPASGPSESPPAAAPEVDEHSVEPATTEPTAEGTAVEAAVPATPAPISPEPNPLDTAAAKPPTEAALAETATPANGGAAAVPPSAPGHEAELATIGTPDPTDLEQMAPAAGTSNASLAARVVNIPNGASFERNMLDAAADLP